MTKEKDHDVGNNNNNNNEEKVLRHFQFGALHSSPFLGEKKGNRVYFQTKEEN